VLIKGFPVSRWYGRVPQVVVLLSALVAVPTCTTRTPANDADSPPHRDRRMDTGSPDGHKVPPSPKVCERPLNGDPNTGEIGYRKCPLCEPDKCPETCDPYRARPLDVERRCWAEPIVVDCALKNSNFAEAEGYSLDVASGTLYHTGDLGLTPPRFRALMGDELRTRLGITDMSQLPNACDADTKRR
jgi:hypothetical protein